MMTAFMQVSDTNGTTRPTKTASSGYTTDATLPGAPIAHTLFSTWLKTTNGTFTTKATTNAVPLTILARRAVHQYSAFNGYRTAIRRSKVKPSMMKYPFMFSAFTKYPIILQSTSRSGFDSDTRTAQFVSLAHSTSVSEMARAPT